MKGLNYIKKKGWEYEGPNESGEIICKKCPYCKNNTWHFYINAKTGLFHCKKANCLEAGNLFMLMKHMGDFQKPIGGPSRIHIEDAKLAKYHKDLLNDSVALQYLHKRKITNEAIEYFNLGLKYKNKVPLLVMPYVENGEVVNIRYRSLKEKQFFWQTGGKIVLYNGDILDTYPEFVIITEGECFLPEAEILTPNGWIKLDLYNGEKVAQWKENNQINFVYPTNYIVNDFNGELIELSNQQNFYSLTTPSHNLVLKNKNGIIKKHAKDLKTTPYHIPRTGKYSGSGVKLKDDEIRLAVAISADFTLRKGGDLYAAFKKERKIKRIKELLTNLQIPYSSSIESRGLTNIFIRRGNSPKYKFKKFPHSWIGQLSECQRKIIIEELVKWDGNFVPNRNQIEYASKYLSNAVFIQTLAHLSEYVSTIMFRKNQYGQWYKVSILFTKQYTGATSLCRSKKRISYKGKVYCVHVDSGMILVRQRGCISVSGNSDAQSIWSRKIKRVVSLPSGASSVKGQWIDKLEKAQRIYVCFDNDTAGKLAAEALAERFDYDEDKIFNVKLPPHVKDVNKYFMEGFTTSDFEAILKRARPFEIKGIIGFQDAVFHWKELQDYGVRGAGLRSPWMILNKKLKDGLIEGDLVIATGRPKVGKTSILLQWAWWAAHEKRVPTLFYCLEMRTERIIPRLMQHILRKEEYSDADVEKVMKEDDVPLYFIQDYSYKSKGEDFIENVRQIVKRYGIKFVIFDNLQLAVDDASQIVAQTSQLSRNFKLLAEELRVPIIVVSHLKKSSSSDRKELERIPTSADLRDSGMVLANADHVFIIHRKPQFIDEEDLDEDADMFSSEGVFVVDRTRFNKGGAWRFYYHTDICYFEEASKTMERKMKEQVEEEENLISEGRDKIRLN